MKFLESSSAQNAKRIKPTSGAVLSTVLAICAAATVAMPGVAPARFSATAPTTSTLEPSTAPSSTSVVASSTPGVGPSTSLSPQQTDEAAVSAVAVEARAVRFAALTSPDDPQAIAALDTYYTSDGAARQEIDALIVSLEDEGLVVRANPNVPDSLVVEMVRLADGPPATKAEVTACVVDTVVTVDGAPPESTETVLSEDFRAFRTVFTLLKQDEMWRVDTAAFVDEWPGETTCPAPPPTTTAPPTTTTPTTIDPVAAEEAAVATRVLEIDSVSWNSLVNLDAPGNADALDAHYTDAGTAREVLESDLQALRDEGWRVRERPELPQSVTVEDVVLLDGPLATRADATVCIVDSTILYEPAGAPDGSDAIVDDEIVAYRSVQHLLFEDGAWQLDEVETIDEWTGVAECPVE